MERITSQGGVFIRCGGRRNGGCIPRSAVVGGEFSSSGERNCHRIVLVGGWGKMKIYKSICLPNQRRRSNLAEEEVKKEVDENCE